MEGQGTKVAEVYIITNNNLLLVHFSGHNNDRLVLKQWKGVLNRVMPSSNMIGTLMIRRQRRQRERRKSNRFNNQSGISLNLRTGRIAQPMRKRACVCQNIDPVSFFF